jgi:hypothetical protein
MPRSLVVAAVVLAALGSSCRSTSAPDPIAARLQNTHIGARLTVGASVGSDSAGVPVIRLDFHNASAEPDTVTHGACSFGVRLYAGTIAGAPVWENPDQPRACIEMLFVREVPPGQTVSVLAGRLAGVPPDVAEPPGGALHAAAVLVVDGQLRIISAGPITLFNR